MSGRSPDRQGGGEPTLAQRLGYGADARLLIVNADDFGMCSAGNRATMAGLLAGAYSSTTVMAPCPWFPQAAAFLRAHPWLDAGVHLTHTSEWATCRWRPLSTDTPTLRDRLGYFPPTAQEVLAAAAPAELEREARAQIETALAAGVDVTHLDSHMGVLQLRPDTHRIYLRLAREYDLPIRWAGRQRLLAAGWGEVVEEMDRLGILAPDRLHAGMPRVARQRGEHWADVIASLAPGVTELYVHPAVDEPELRDLMPGWELRVADHAFFAGGPAAAMLEAHGVRRIGYREIRERQRAGRG